MLKKTFLTAGLFAFCIALFSFNNVKKEDQAMDEQSKKCSASIAITISDLQPGCSVSLQSPNGVVTNYTANGTYYITLAAPWYYGICENTGQSGEPCDPNGIQVTWVKTCGASIEGGHGTVSGPNCLNFYLTCC